MTDHDSGADPGRVVLTSATLRGLSPQDFAALGNDEVAYLRPVVLNGARAFSIHAADGTPIGAAPRGGCEAPTPALPRFAGEGAVARVRRDFYAPGGPSSRLAGTSRSAASPRACSLTRRR